MHAVNIRWLHLAVLCAFLSCIISANASTEKSLVLIISSYNNRTWVEKNVTSVCMQRYSHYRVIYIDDCSTDGTYESACEIVRRYGHEHRWTFVRNKQRRKLVANLYNAIHACADDDIVIELDGDDWLPHEHVLSHINSVYTENPSLWLTYGQFKTFPDNKIGFSHEYPMAILTKNAFRKHGKFISSHMHTNYAWLFKLIKLEDLLHEGNFYPCAADVATVTPMLELAGKDHFKCLKEILYIYNTSNPHSVTYTNQVVQFSLRSRVYEKRPYSMLKEKQSVEQLVPRDKADLIVISWCTPSLLKRFLMTLGAIRHAGSTQVLYRARNDTQAKAYNAIKQEFPALPCISLDRAPDSLRSALIEACMASQHNYSMLVTDRCSLLQQINTQGAIKVLKKTAVPAFYYAIGSLDREFFAGQPLAPVSLDEQRTAWVCTYKGDYWRMPVLEATLWSKEYLVTILRLTVPARTFQEFRANLEYVCKKSATVGIMRLQKSVQARLLSKRLA